MKKSVVRLLNHHGDECIASYDPTSAPEVSVAQEALTTFLNDCISKHGKMPPVFAKRIGQYDEPCALLNIKRENNKITIGQDLSLLEEVYLTFPLVGG